MAHKGRSYELLVRDIFAYIQNQGDIKNVHVRHGVKLTGLSFKKHQIDVYWEFEQGGIRHVCIVEAKNYKRKVTQEDLQNFAFVLSDLPHQPRGIFVSRLGYSLEVETAADRMGIILFVLAEPEKESLRLPVDSLATFRQAGSESLTLSNGEIYSRVKMECVVHRPDPTNITYTPSQNWVKNFRSITGLMKLEQIPIVFVSGFKCIQVLFVPNSRPRVEVGTISAAASGSPATALGRGPKREVL